MTVYLLSGAIALLCVLIAQRDGAGKRQADLLWLVAFATLWLPAALRVNVGVDYSRYQGYSELYQIYASGGELSQGMDLGFVALVRGLAALGAGPQWLFAVTSALVVGLTLHAARRLSDEPATAVALFLVAGLYFESLNIVRQWIAIAFVLNALEWVADDGPARRRSLPRYCCWVLAGALFHETCLLWLAMWPVFAVLRDRMGARASVALVALGVLAIFLLREAAQAVLAGTRFGRYLVVGSGIRSQVSSHLDTIATGVVMLAFVLWSMRGRGRCGEWDACLLVCQSLGLALALSGLFLPSVADRLVRYFVPLLVLQLPRGLSRVGDERLRGALRLAIIGCWVMVTFVRVVYGGQYGVLPYRCVLFA